MSGKKERVSVPVLLAGLVAVLWVVAGCASATATEEPTPTPSPQAGSTRIWEMDDSVMVYVPEGAFWMGSHENDTSAAANEMPQHQVTLDAFWIDRTEVTNGQYRRCVEGGACSPPSSSASSTRESYYEDPGFDDYPVVMVNWAQANAYCAWAGKRLPTEAEWEKAARGTHGLPYPWGNTFDGSLVNFCDANCAKDDRKSEDWDDGYGDTAPVGNYGDGASPYGALDMAGNVWEWVADWGGADYYAHSPDSNPQGPDTGTSKVVRGGSWYEKWTTVRAAYRSTSKPVNAGPNIGFRCVVSPEERPSPVYPGRPELTDTPEPTQTPVPPTDMPRPPAITPGAVLETGAIGTWEKDNSVMVYVPAGAFWMGSSDEDVDAILAECSYCQRDWYAHEQPQHEVTLDAFWIDRTEVTNGQYRRCVEDGVCGPPSSSASYSGDSYYDDPDFDDYPVIKVNWEQANAYCAWAGKRLPTEAEWEKAASGTEGWLFPWGDSFDGSSANFCDANCMFDHRNEGWDDGYAETAPVGSYGDGASPYGALDMAGNVWEWVADWYSEDYYANSPGSNPQGPSTGTLKVLRGGTWHLGWEYVRAAFRNLSNLDHSGYSIGFRCVVSANERPSPASAGTPKPLPTPVPPTNTPTSPTATPRRTLEAGAIGTWEKDDSLLVYVPAGAFWMGSSDEDIDAILAECSDCQRDWYTDEQPQHKVTLDAFWIDRTEVTNGQYRRCVEDGVCSPPSSSASYSRDSYYDDPSFDAYPVVMVNWDQANAYCAWAGKRLPTEAEWEKAARGTEGWLFPWGNTFDGNLVNFCDANCTFDYRDEDWNDGYADTAPVGSFRDGASPYGALDMAGNVWEWVADWGGADYYANSPGSNPQGPSTGTLKVLRGGSWAGPWYVFDTALRNVNVPSYQSYGFGFRCAMSSGR